MNILVTENLKKYYRMGENVVKALDGVSISIQQGEFLGIKTNLRYSAGGRLDLYSRIITFFR